MKLLSFDVGPDRPFFLIAGPCVIESEALCIDVAGRLNTDDRIAEYTVEAENFESIHNHSAYALIERDKDAE